MGILALLAGILMASLPGIYSAANRAVAVSQMHQIGAAIVLYTGDNDGFLPGGLLQGQKGIYDPASSGELATFLGPYLGIPSGASAQPLAVFFPPAYLNAVPGMSTSDMRPFVINSSISVGNSTIAPWGSALAPVAGPMKLTSLQGSMWGFTDADQANVLVKGKSWASFTPVQQVHYPERYAWYFDGTVQFIAESDIIAPPSPKKTR